MYGEAQGPQYGTGSVDPARAARNGRTPALNPTCAARWRTESCEPITSRSSRLQVGGIVGAEALLRWAHPYRGLVMPDVLIPIAEQSGLIREIGLWVLRRASAIDNGGVTVGAIPTTWRFSSTFDYQLMSRDYTAAVAAVLTKTDTDPTGDPRSHRKASSLRTVSGLGSYSTS